MSELRHFALARNAPALLDARPFVNQGRRRPHARACAEDGRAVGLPSRVRIRVLVTWSLQYLHDSNLNQMQCQKEFYIGVLLGVGRL